MTKITYADGDAFNAYDANDIALMNNINMASIIFTIKSLTYALKPYGANAASYQRGMSANFVADRACFEVFNEKGFIDTTNTNMTSLRGCLAYSTSTHIPMWGVYFYDQASADREVRTRILKQSNRTITRGMMSVAYTVANLLDNFQDGAENNFTFAGTGSHTETGGYQQISTSGAQNESAYYTGKNYYGTNKRAIAITHLDTAGTLASTLTVGVHDTAAAQEATIINTDMIGAASGDRTILVEWQFDSNNDSCAIYANGTLINVLDCSGFGNNFRYLYFKTASTLAGSSALYQIYALGDYDFTSYTTTVDCEVSVDGGSNFEACNLDEFHTFTNTGQYPILKFTGNVAANELLIVYGLGFIHN